MNDTSEKLPNLKRPRPDLLRGVTKKVRWPSLDHAHYLTLNFDEEGSPFEVFITSKDADHQEWMQAISLLLTSIFRRGGNVTFWVAELRQVHSAAGGHLLNKTFHPSLVAYLAAELETLLGLGLPPLRVVATTNPAGLDRALFIRGYKNLDVPINRHEKIEVADADRVAPVGSGWSCPRCRAGALFRREGCDVCGSCDYSRCG